MFQFSLDVKFHPYMGVEPKIGGKSTKSMEFVHRVGTMKFSPSMLGENPLFLCFHRYIWGRDFSNLTNIILNSDEQ